MQHAFLDWDKVEEHTIVPGYRAKFIHSEHMTFALWNIDEGAGLPPHSHPHEQVTQVLEGVFALSIDGKMQVLETGGIAVIPPHAHHGGTAQTNCRVLDVFYPLREDYKI